ncbi:MAG: YgiT-type zinc finger protein [Calditrichota bacterium]
MKCIYCQGEMRRASAPFHIDRQGIHLSFDDLPAWVCNQCGEAYFEEAEVNSIQAILREVDRQVPRLMKTA